MNIGIDVFSIILLSMGLAMDAFSVALVTGFGLGKMKLALISKIAISFGLAHVFMPILGWFMGSAVLNIIANYDHWAAFILLAIVGGRMVYEGLYNEEKVDATKMLSHFSLFLFTIAVSIDSLAVGLSFSLERISIYIPSFFMGAGTSIFTLIGLLIGNKTGQGVGNKAQILGGLVLFIIGIRIILSHVK